jgi:hypothetical protein
VPRFLSPEWAAAFNEALGDVPESALGSLDVADSLLASTRSFTVHQVVTGGPEGDVDAFLRVADRSVTMVCPPSTPEESRVPEDSGAAFSPDVTVTLDWDSAVALSRGDLSPTHALAEGKVRVRGDLSVLLASQHLLSHLQPRLKDLQAATTY